MTKLELFNEVFKEIGGSDKTAKAADDEAKLMGFMPSDANEELPPHEVEPWRNGFRVLLNELRKAERKDPKGFSEWLDNEITARATKN